MSEGEEVGQFVINNVSILDVIQFVSKKNGRYIATMLARIEDIIPPDSETFQEVRKIVLDGMNDFSRAILIEIFGNIEGLT